MKLKAFNLALGIIIFSAVFGAFYSLASADTVLFNNIGVGVAPNQPYGSNGGGCNIYQIFPVSGGDVATSSYGRAEFLNFNFASGTNQVTFSAQILDSSNQPLSATSSIDLWNFSTNTIVTIPVVNPPVLSSNQEFRIATVFTSNPPYTCDTGDFGMWVHNGQGTTYTPVDYFPDMSVTDYSPDNTFVDFVFPYNGSSSADFAYWNLTIDTPTNLSENMLVEVLYSQSTSTLTFDYADSIIVPKRSYADTIVNSLNIRKLVSLAPLGTATSSVWYAQAFIFENASTTELARSEMISFTVLNNDFVDSQWPTSTLGGYNDTFICLSIYSDFGNCMKNAFRYLVRLVFVPSDASLKSLSDAWDSLKYQFPFSIVFGLEEVLSQQLVVGASSTIPTLSVTISPLGTLNLLSSSTLSNVIGQTRKDLLFDIMENLIWLSAAIVLFKMIRETFEVEKTRTSL